MCHREVQATSGLDTHLTVMADLHPLPLPPLPASGNHQSVFWILDKLALLEQSENLKTSSWPFWPYYLFLDETRCKNYLHFFCLGNTIKPSNNWKREKSSWTWSQGLGCPYGSQAHPYPSRSCSHSWAGSELTSGAVIEPKETHTWSHLRATTVHHQSHIENKLKGSCLL